MLDRAHEIGCAECIVDYERHMMAVSHMSHSVDVEHFGIGVAERLAVHHLGVRLYCRVESVEVGKVDYRMCDSALGQGINNEIECAPVEVVGGNDMVAGQQNVFKGICHGSRSRCHGQCGHASFEGRHAFLEHVLGGIRQASVDIAFLFQGETVGRALARIKYVRCGLVYRHGAGIGRGVGMLLPDVKLQCLEMKFAIVHIK